jgi:hypothetical protein
VNQHFQDNTMSDHQHIIDLVHTYGQSIHDGDVARLRSTFDPRAQLFGEVKGEPYHRNLEDYLSAVAKRQSPRELGHAYALAPLGVDVQGAVAVARLHFPLLGFNYVDYLSLVKTNGHWLIVNKTFTHVPA